MGSKLARLRRLVPSLVALTLAGILFVMSRQPVSPGTGRRMDWRAASDSRRSPCRNCPDTPTTGKSGGPSQPASHPILALVRRGRGRPRGPRRRRLAQRPRAGGSADRPGDRRAGARDEESLDAVRPGPLHSPFDRSTMAPMGARVGDFNEDGYADILVYYWGRSPILFQQRPDPAARGPAVLSAESVCSAELVEPYQVWFTSAVRPGRPRRRRACRPDHRQLQPGRARVLDRRPPESKK